MQVAVVGPGADREFLRRVRVVEADVGVEPDLLYNRCRNALVARLWCTFKLGTHDYTLLLWELNVDQVGLRSFAPVTHKAVRSADRTTGWDGEGGTHCHSVAGLASLMFSTP